jgi:short-subunit dehydrogenase
MRIPISPTSITWLRPIVAATALATLTGGCALTRPDESLANKTVVVTGASSGLGRGMALELARRQANVVIAARNTSALEQLAREAHGGNVHVVTTDVGRPEEMERLAREAITRFGHIDVWINNAGAGALGRFEEIPLVDQLRLVNINLEGVILGSHHALRHFRDRGRGTLINIASVEGRVPLPYQATYVATKHAVVGLGASLNQELRLAKQRDIHVVTVNPFATDTPFFLHSANYTGHSPRSVLLDPPEKVVAAVLGAIERPQPEIAVGWKAKASQTSHRLSRRLTEATVAAIYHREQLGQAPPAEHTSGSLHDPGGEGGSVDGGNEERIALEDSVRRVDRNKE